MNRSMIPALGLALLLVAVCGAPAARATGLDPRDGIDVAFTEHPFAGPAGWRSMCRDTPSLCRGVARSRPVVLTPERRRALAAVNAAVNAAILPRAERGTDGWRVAPSRGDCEDYALTKRERLLAQGWPGGALRFAAATTERGEFHLVLLAETNRGTLVLDNRFARPLRWATLGRLGYRWIGVERWDRRGWRLGADAVALAGRPAARDEVVAFLHLLRASATAKP